MRVGPAVGDACLGHQRHGKVEHFNGFIIEQLIDRIVDRAEVVALGAGVGVGVGAAVGAAVGMCRKFGRPSLSVSAVPSSASGLLSPSESGSRSSGPSRTGDLVVFANAAGFGIGIHPCARSATR